MKRTFATTTFAFALLGVAACKGGGGDAAKLIPESATMVGGVDLAALQSTQSWKDNKGMVESQGKEVLDAMSACNLGLDKWKSLTFGVDPSGGEKFAAVVVADGLGKKENLDCAAGKIKEKSGKDPWTAEEEGKVLKMDGDKGVAYVVDDNTIAVASKDWADAVKGLTKGEGKNAFDGPLKDVIGRTDTGKHVWFAGKIPDDAKGMAKMAGDIGEPQDVAGWMDLSGGIELWVAVGLKDADQATKAKDTIQTQFDGMKAMAGQFGVPQGVVDSVKFDTKDNAFTVTAKASDADLKTIQEKVMGGMMGGM
ncbi:hypothetical protein [Paraliomyxa miuraensis]|uniref:hypothetical protein n=1 Tax=Paraliomyxa miuraensis TaxID=376150 RepID=UPI002258F667|nr:hypothetical protein [Paraliomyxa miuraensis]MCX4244807.1 hypothetical protein [Paraliomyxa miuraensis]